MNQELQKLGEAAKELRAKLFDLENTILQMRDYIQNTENIDEIFFSKRISTDYYKIISARADLASLMEEFNRKYE
jgi:hypothetical protein